MRENRPIIALDFASRTEVQTFLEQFPSQEKLFVKVGMELYYAEGPDIIHYLKDCGHSIFLDLKLHDIPNTVAKAVSAAAELGVWMVNVHASGGPRMMTAARDALQVYGAQRPLLIAVTVLTSMEQDELTAIGVQRPLEEQVLQLATLTQQCGLDGVVCSAREAAVLKQTLGAAFQLVTPGIRPANAELGDQRRVLTPVDAVRQGSDYLVIGRPITQAADPAAVLAEINASLRAI